MVLRCFKYRNAVLADDVTDDCVCVRCYSPPLLSLVTVVTGNGDGFFSLGSGTTEDTCMLMIPINSSTK